LLNNGLEIINNNPSVDTLHPIVCAIIDLMPADQKPNGDGLLR
jgi:hypothetical protein